MMLWHQCEVCGSMTQPSWGIHICYNRKEKPTVVLKKKWSPTLRCWVLDSLGAQKDNKTPDAEGGKGLQYYDGVKNEWVDVKPDKVVNGKIVNEAEYSTCAIPYKEPKMLGPGDPGDETKGDSKEHHEKCSCNGCKPEALRSHGYYCYCTPCVDWRKVKGITTSGYTYTPPVMPWENIDFMKYPNTFMYLIKFHHHRDEDRGLYISNEDYKARIYEGKYKPEPRKITYHSDHDYYSPYGGEA